jgi:hypothetical protein
MGGSEEGYEVCGIPIAVRSYSNYIVFHFQNKKGFVKYKVLTAVTVKNCVFWDVMPRGSLL